MIEGKRSEKSDDLYFSYQAFSFDHFQTFRNFAIKLSKIAQNFILKICFKKLRKYIHLILCFLGFCMKILDFSKKPSGNTGDNSLSIRLGVIRRLSDLVYSAIFSVAFCIRVSEQFCFCPLGGPGDRTGTMFCIRSDDVTCANVTPTWNAPVRFCTIIPVFIWWLFETAQYCSM